MVFVTEEKRNQQNSRKLFSSCQGLEEVHIFNGSKHVDRRDVYELSLCKNLKQILLPDTSF